MSEEGRPRAKVRNGDCGLLVQRQDTWLASRKSGFKSSAVHSITKGSWSNGKTPVRQTGNPGSTPGSSTEEKRKVSELAQEAAC